MSPYTSPTPVSGFLDPGDATLFPRLTAAQIERLAERAETVSLSPGEILFEQGQRDTPFYVVLSGAVNIVDRQPDGDRYFTQCQTGTFIGDISMFTGEPTIARGVVAEETSLLALAPALPTIVRAATADPCFWRRLGRTSSPSETYEAAPPNGWHRRSETAHLSSARSTMRSLALPLPARVPPIERPAADRTRQPIRSASSTMIPSGPRT